MLNFRNSLQYCPIKQHTKKQANEKWIIKNQISGTMAVMVRQDMESAG